jgi:hypothetical protein
MSNDRQCLVCGSYGTVTLGIRARYSNTNAAWAPNLEAFLCKTHAEAGMEIKIEMIPTNDGRVTTYTTGPRGTHASSLVIGTGAKVTPGQVSLL